MRTGDIAGNHGSGDAAGADKGVATAVAPLVRVQASMRSTFALLAEVEAARANGAAGVGDGNVGADVDVDVADLRRHVGECLTAVEAALAAATQAGDATPATAAALAKAASELGASAGDRDGDERGSWAAGCVRVEGACVRCA